MAGRGRLRGQTVLPAVVALMAIILFTQMAIYAIQLNSLRAQVTIEEERVVAARQLQTLFRIVDYEWIPVDEYRAKLRVVLQNVGRIGAKIVYLAVALEDDSKYPPIWLWSQEWKAPGAIGDIPQELSVEAREWSSDNYPVVKPGGYLTIETTEPINLPILYTNPNTTIAVYVATVYGVQVLRILGKPACIEVDAYLNGKAADLALARITRGVSTWPYTTIASTSGYLKICGLAPGEYTLDLKLAADGFQAERLVRLTLGDGETKTIYMDVYSPPRKPIPPSGNVSFVLDFDHKPERSVWVALRRLDYLHWFGWDASVSYDEVAGLQLKAQGYGGFEVRLPVPSGTYDLVIGLRTPYTPWPFSVPNATDADLRVYVSGVLVFDAANATRLPSSVAGDEGAEYWVWGNCTLTKWSVESITSVTLQGGALNDYTLYCRGVRVYESDPWLRLVFTDQYLMCTDPLGLCTNPEDWQLVNGSIDVRLWHIAVLPATSPYPDIVWSGVIHPGDVYNVTCDASGNCTLVKVEDGLLHWWPLDRSTYDVVRGVELVTGGGVVAWRLGEGGVDGSWLYTWLTRDNPTAVVSALVDCTSSKGCVASFWASTMLWSGFEVLVDGVRADYSPFTVGLVHKWIPVPEGTHNLTIVYRLGGIMTSFEAGLDELWVAKSNTITIKGVEPGWRVILRYYDPVTKQWLEETATAYTSTVTLKWPLDTKPETTATIIIRRT